MGLDLTQFYAELRTDLKDSGTVWSDTELKRSIERAVDDLSRYLPLERIYEITYSYAVTSESFTTPATGSDTAIVNAVTLNGETSGATLSIASIFANATTPRPVKFTLTDANNSITGLTVIVKGLDYDGHYIEESFSLANGKVQSGKKYFKWFTQVEANYIFGSASAADLVSIGTDNAYDVWLELANKPIAPGTETVTNAAGTACTRDTDYTMDYANGRIKYINGGSIAAGETCDIDYDKSRLGVDVSEILPVLTRITEVEYPVNKVPQQKVSFNVWGNFLIIGSPKSGASQERLNASEHIAIYYERKQLPPSLHSDGSYPDYLDEVISIGAGAYALLIEAQQYEQQAVTDLASARTELGLTTAIHTKVDAVLTLVADYINEAHTQIGKMDTYTVDTAGSGTDNAKDRLAEITDIEAYLRAMIIKLADGTGALADANTYLDNVSAIDLDAATVGSIAWLLEGELLINTVNIGDRVPENFREYAMAKVATAQARTSSAMGFISEAGLRLDFLRTYIEESAAWLNIADRFAIDAGQRLAQGQTYITEAQARITEIGTHLAEAAQYEAIAMQDMTLSDRFRAEGLQRLAEFYTILRDKSEYRRRVVSVPVTQPPAGKTTTKVSTTQLGV